MTNAILIGIIIEHFDDAYGGLAQLARAPALQAGGHRFEPDILHQQLNTDIDFVWQSGFKRRNIMRNLIIRRIYVALGETYIPHLLLRQMKS